MCCCEAWECNVDPMDASTLLLDTDGILDTGTRSGDPLLNPNGACFTGVPGCCGTCLSDPDGEGDFLIRSRLAFLRVRVLPLVVSASEPWIPDSIGGLRPGLDWIKVKDVLLGDSWPVL